MRRSSTMSPKRLALTCIAAVLLVGAAAWADSIGPTCGSGECLGNIYTLNYSQTSAQMGTDNYTITLMADSSGFVDGTDSGFLMAVSPNISGWSNATLIGAAGGTSDWSAVKTGGLNSGRCNGHGTPFFCNDTLSQGSFNEVGSSTPLTFVWTITDSALPTGTDQAAIKALFEDSSGKNLGITSADITLQRVPAAPEPSSLVDLTLVLAVLLTVLFFQRRRITQN